MTPKTETLVQPLVLCVDDEPNVLKALERVLCRFGCKVLLAANGQEALQVLRRTPVQVLICDEAMPGMRGVEVLSQAKVISPSTARILLTAHCSQEEVVMPAVNEGRILRLLSKPWVDEEIKAAVTAALGAEPREWSRRLERVAERLRGGGSK